MLAHQNEVVFRYPFPSTIDRGQADQTLRLATFNDSQKSSPFFFEGELVNPKRMASLLRGIMSIVKSRFHIPPAMLSRILAESDPVVTCNDDRLRFEGFSACCGVYTRADFLSPAFKGKVNGRGTTNVDFNQPMLAALARIKENDKVSLAVGTDQVVLKRPDTEIVEKKVKLPLRWMKGFVEVQAVQSRMKRVHQLSGVQAFRFLRSMPKMKTHRRATYVARSGQGLRLAQVQTNDAVCVGGLERLKVLESLAKDAMALSIYSDDLTHASGWVLEFPDCRFHLVISPEVWRGFSGEGQALNDLAKSAKSALPKVRAQLKWQAVIDRDKVVRSTKVRKELVDTALAMLGTRGLVGFDVMEQAYFHREMPFDVTQVEKQQPRLLAARKLIAEQKVQIHRQNKSQSEFRIGSSDVEHRVVIKAGSRNKNGEARCTCPWFNRHSDSRGPCKHILAAQMFLEESAPG